MKSTNIEDYIVQTETAEWKPLLEQGVDTSGISIKVLRRDENGRPPSFLAKFDQAVDRGNEEELKKYEITITKDSPIFRQQAIEEFENQILNYLRATDVEAGLLLNFGKKPEIRRKVFANSNKKIKSI